MTGVQTCALPICQHEGWELVDIYADEGLTGTRMDQREDFNRMMADCRKGRIDRVLVKSISRFSRNTKDCLSALRELTQLGVTVQFEKVNTARSLARNQFAQYGMTNVPEDAVERFAKDILKDEKSRPQIARQTSDMKLFNGIRASVTPDVKEVSVEEFNQLFAPAAE